ncbi:hypothetical protein PM082_024747 [Marasmius tenuissimus]|nr:hypothetical protein PM082_024747 [Marasmius tenuissimus]
MAMNMMGEDRRHEYAKSGQVYDLHRFGLRSNLTLTPRAKVYASVRPRGVSLADFESRL